MKRALLAALILGLFGSTARAQVTCVGSACGGSGGSGSGDLLSTNNLSDVASASTSLSNLGGQPLNASLTSISSVTFAADKCLYFTAATTVAAFDCTSFGRSIVNAADAAALRTLAALGTIATQNSNSVSISGGSITGITDLAVADGGTGNSTGTATINANLTGIVTSTGNATAIANGAIALAKLANGTAGNVVTYDAAGAIAVAATGTAGQCFTSNGAGAAPTMQTCGSGGGITALTGDVTASGSGSVAATIANDAVTYAKIQNVSATDKVLGRSTAGAGDVEEIAMTAAGRALVDDADATAQRTTLGLGTIATQAANSVSITGGSVTGITDLAVADGGTGNSTGTATINADLTGPVTSSGNATAIANGAIALAKLANGTAGNVVTYDAAGVIAAVATGTATHVLTSNGAGAAPTFQAAGAASVTANVMSTASTCADAGSTDTFACNLAATPTYSAGLWAAFKANTINTGTASINFNSVGVLTIVKTIGGITQVLATGDIRAGAWVLGFYDGTNFQCVSGCNGNDWITPAPLTITGPTVARSYAIANQADTIVTVAGLNTFTDAVKFNGKRIVFNNLAGIEGNASLAQGTANNILGFWSAVAPDSMALGAGSDSNAWHMAESSDIFSSEYNFQTGCTTGLGTVACTDPTWIIHSHNQDTGEFSSQAHDGKAAVWVGGNSTALNGTVRLGGSVTLTESSATTVLTVPVAVSTGTGGEILYSVVALDSTNTQTRTGRILYAVANTSGGTETCNAFGISTTQGVAGDTTNAANPTEIQDGSGVGAITSGTLTYAWSVDTSGTNSCVLKLNAVSSLTQTTFIINYTVVQSGPGVSTGG